MCFLICYLCLAIVYSCLLYSLCTSASCLHGMDMLFHHSWGYAVTKLEDVQLCCSPWHMAFQCSSYLQHSRPYFILIRHWTLSQLIVSLFNSIVSFHQHNLFEEVLHHQSKQTQHNRVFCFHLIMLVQYMFHMDKYIVFTSFHIFGSTTSEQASCMDEFETISKAVFLCPNILANHWRYGPRDVTPKSSFGIGTVFPKSNDRSIHHNPPRF